VSEAGEPDPADRDEAEIDALISAADPERVREIVDYWERSIDAGQRKASDASDAGREFMRSFTPAEILAASRLVLDEADAHTETLLAIRDDPDGPAAQMSRMVHAGEPYPFEGLPDDAVQVFIMRVAAPCDGEYAARAAERMAAWTSADRLAFEERFASQLPSGGHWPG
jgi:hypothetical protein